MPERRAGLLYPHHLFGVTLSSGSKISPQPCVPSCCWCPPLAATGCDHQPYSLRSLETDCVFLPANLDFNIHVTDPANNLFSRLLNFLTLLAVQFHLSTDLPGILYLVGLQKSKHESISLLTSLLPHILSHLSEASGSPSWCLPSSSACLSLFLSTLTP